MQKNKQARQSLRPVSHTHGSTHALSPLRFSTALICALVNPVLLTLTPSITHAAIVPDGDYTPNYNGVADPWNVGGDLKVGDTALGSLTITGGSSINAKVGYVGYGAGAIGNLTIAGASSSWDSSGVHVGEYGIGVLNIEAGAYVEGNASYVGYAEGSSGTVTVAGSGSLWRNWNLLQIGTNAGSYGELRINDGGLVRTEMSGSVGVASGSTGVVSVSGLGSLWRSQGILSIGNAGDGVLNIGDGGSVLALAGIWTGVNSNGTGRINFTNGTLDTRSLQVSPSDLHGTGVVLTKGIVSDIDLLFDQNHGSQQQLIWDNQVGQNININLDVSDPLAFNSRLGVGYHGVGNMTVSDGVEVFSQLGELGVRLGSSGTANIIGDGSKWNTWGSLDIGINGDGVLNVFDGGMVVSSSSHLGILANSSGVVNVAGDHSTWIVDNDLTISNQGSGALIVNTGGTVEIAGDLRIGTYGLGASIIQLRGGIIRLEGGSISQPFYTGTFEFSSGTLVGVGAIDIKQPFVQVGGTLAPGGSIGQTDIIGDYNLNSGTLEIEVGGAGNTHDQLTATGDIDIAMLGTTLELPALGAMAEGTYSVIESTGGTITGTFENITGIGIYAGLVDVQYSSNAVTITLNWDFVPGDMDGDGFVGINDLNTVLVNWNQNVTPGDLSSGETSGDGFVGIDDLTTVLGNWNAGTPPPPEIFAAIPEPGTAGLLAIGVIWSCGRRRAPRA